MIIMREPQVLENGNPEILNFSCGRYVYDKDQFQYFIKDHLGNNVVLFTDDNEDLNP